MKPQSISIEKLLFYFALVLALGVRLFNLGEMPLSDYEAGFAMKAWDVAQGGDVVIDTQPGYVLTTGALFALLGSNAFIARLLPALAGSLVLLAIYAFRDQIGSKPMLVMAFGIALDPGMIAISRVAGGPMLAISFLLLSIAALRTSQPVLTGILFGCTLLSGPAFFMGLLIIVMTYVLIRWSLGDRTPHFTDSLLIDARYKESSVRRTMLISAAIAVFVIGTHFLQHPQGLTAIIAGIPAYFQSWFDSSEISAGRELVTLVTMQPLGFLFALLAVFRGRREEDTNRQAYAVWLLVAAAIVLLSPGRQLHDLGWVLIPMWALAGIGLSHFLVKDRENDLQSLALASLIFILLVFIWINLSVLVETFTDTQLYTIRWAIVGIAFAMGVMSTILVAIGWSTQIARQGLIWGVALSLGFYAFAAIWGGGETDWGGKSPQQASLLLDTIGDMSEKQVGRREDIDIVYQSNTPSVAWLLREYPRAHSVDSLSIVERPSMILTVRSDIEPAFGAEYSGQSFVWRVYDEWSGFLPPDWLRWIAYRKTAITNYDEVILWARADIFPEGALIPDRDIDVPIEN